MLAIRHGGLDGGENQLLAGAGLAIGKDQPFRGLPALGSALAGGFPGAENGIDTPADGGFRASKCGSRLSRSVSSLLLAPIAINTSSARTGAASARASIQA